MGILRRIAKVFEEFSWNALPEDKVPAWVKKAEEKWTMQLYRSGGLLYGRRKHFAGKSFVYRIWFEMGYSQGEIIRHYYRKTRKNNTVNNPTELKN